MKFIPQALADNRSKTILHVFRDEHNFNTFWKGKFETEDASGIETHPSFIRVGDVIDFYATGWEKQEVTNVKFEPHEHTSRAKETMTGNFQFTTKGGSFINATVENGNYSRLPIYVFKKDNE